MMAKELLIVCLIENTVTAVCLKGLKSISFIVETTVCYQLLLKHCENITYKMGEKNNV